ncbi:hypothetical protein AB0B15_10575 [Streptomyces sp. NPDC045456]
MAHGRHRKEKGWARLRQLVATFLASLAGRLVADRLSRVAWWPWN